MALIGEHLREPLEAYELLLIHGQAELVVVEGVAPSIQGQVAEQEHRHQEGEHHQEELILLGQLLLIHKIGEERREQKQRQGYVQERRRPGGADGAGHSQCGQKPRYQPGRERQQEEQNGQLLVLVGQHGGNARQDQYHSDPAGNAEGLEQLLHQVFHRSGVQFAVLGFFLIDGLALGVGGMEQFFRRMEGQGFQPGDVHRSQHLVLAGLSEGNGGAGQQHEGQRNQCQRQRDHLQAALFGNGIDEVRLVGIAHTQHAAAGAGQSEQRQQHGRDRQTAQTQLTKLAGGGREHISAAKAHQAHHRSAHADQRQHAQAQREPAVHPGQEGQQRRQRQQDHRRDQIGVGRGGGGTDGKNALNVIGVVGIGHQYFNIAGQHAAVNALFRGLGPKVRFVSKHFLPQRCGAVHSRRVRRVCRDAFRHGHHMGGQQQAQHGQNGQHAACQPERPIGDLHSRSFLQADEAQNRHNQTADSRGVDPRLIFQKQGKEDRPADVGHLQGEGKGQGDGKEGQHNGHARPPFSRHQRRSGQRQQHQARDQHPVVKGDQPQLRNLRCRKAVRPFEHNVPHGDRFGKQRRRFLSQLAMDIHLGRRKEQRG